MKSTLVLIALALACAACVAEAPADVPPGSSTAVVSAPPASTPTPSPADVTAPAPPAVSEGNRGAAEPAIPRPSSPVPDQSAPSATAPAVRGRISPSELRAALDRGEAILVDVRGDADWAFRRAGEAIHIPYADLFARSVELPHEKLIALYCT